MMMVMVGMVVAVGWVAMLVGALLIGFFKFQGGVAYAVFFEFFLYLFLDFTAVGICDNMHCGVVVDAVDAPHVEVMNTFYAFNLQNMVRKLIQIYAMGSFFNE